MNQDASYYIVIPGSVRADKTLNAEQKFLYGEIASKCNMTGFCWASNETLCKIVGCAERTLQRNLLALQRGNHIRIEFKKTSKGTSRRIWLVDSRDVPKVVFKVVEPDKDGDATRQIDEVPPAKKDHDITLKENSKGKEESPAPSAAGGSGDPGKGKKAGEKKPPRPHWQAFVNTFHDDYVKHHHGEEPSLDGRPVGDLAKLYDRLQHRAQRKGMVWTEANLKGMFAYFLQIARKNDWLKLHWLVKNLLEQFDSVYAREAAEGKPTAAEKKAPPASNEGPQAHVEYIVERYREGNLDERIIDQYWFDRLVSLRIMGINDFENYAGETPEARKIAAFKHWLHHQKTPA
jgi:helix-turn-helix protein